VSSRAPGPGLPEVTGPSSRFDAVVVGSGVAGCAVALRLAAAGARVAVVTKGVLGASTTEWAQGGIAAAFPVEGDSAELHLADTLRAGVGLCDPEATRILVEGGPQAVLDLVALGAVFDRDERGGLARSREGGHSTARVVHAGGTSTGAEVVRALVARVGRAPVTVLERTFALALVVEHGRCTGIDVLDAGGTRRLVASQTVLATGGAGQLFDLTTNPLGATGDGIALSLRAGVPLADLEFVQFHPTALAVHALPRPLLSEALRGEGAVLLDGRGERFVDELAPRDVVSRAIAARMAEEGTDHVDLDARPVEGFARRFPGLAVQLAGQGLDPASDLLPVAPAAHYLCGGVLTDLDGASAVEGLWAVGEVACTGVQGANRLASNSLLEGLVFATRAAAAIMSGRGGPLETGALGPWLGGPTSAGSIPVRPVAGDRPDPASSPPEGMAGDVVKEREVLQHAMGEGAGVVRSAASLEGVERTLGELRRGAPAAGSADPRHTVAALELANLAEVAAAMLRSARARQESRGAHFRADFPATDDAWRLRLVVGRRASPLGAAAPALERRRTREAGAP